MYTWFSAQLTWGKGNENDFFFVDLTLLRRLVVDVGAFFDFS